MAAFISVLRFVCLRAIVFVCSPKTFSLSWSSEAERLIWIHLDSDSFRWHSPAPSLSICLCQFILARCWVASTVRLLDTHRSARCLNWCEFFTQWLSGLQRERERVKLADFIRLLLWLFVYNLIKKNSALRSLERCGYTPVNCRQISLTFSGLRLPLQQSNCAESSLRRVRLLKSPTVEKFLEILSKRILLENHQKNLRKDLWPSLPSPKMRGSLSSDYNYCDCSHSSAILRNRLPLQLFEEWFLRNPKTKFELNSNRKRFARLL